MANFYLYTLFLLVSQTPFVFLQEVTSDPYRLPTTLSPTHYEVHLNISPEAFTANGTAYTGTVVINFQPLVNTSQIVLHSSARFITINDVTLNNEIIPEGNYSVNSTTDILTIDYSGTLLIARTYALAINFDGRLSSTDMYGWYKSSYEDADGVTRYLATTQFQSTYARRAFPCWDEPAFKASFTVLLTYPSELNALSNTPGTLRINDTTNNLLTTEFAQTPVMSSYLVAFIVSDFTCTSGENVGDVPTRVCSRAETANIRDWSVEVAPKILTALNEYTNYEYNASMTKMDQVAIPDFAAGAMENWGLVTYRETGLLWDPLESATSYRQSIAAVIAHEFTHMWFGNLVTCNWWSETFLNEGFARLLQYSILDEFVTVVLQAVMETDSYLTSQALQSNASTPSEVSAKFGTITYSKGASVLRMVEHAIGVDAFRTGIRNYLKDHAYSSTLPEDLWTSLNAASVNSSTTQLPTDLNTIMENWVKKSGFPLLTVTVSGRNVIITQERFLLSGRDRSSKWYVPVTFTTSADTNGFANTIPENWLTPDTDVSIALPTGAEWIILNNHETAFYRVNYDEELWNNLTRALASSNFSNIPEINRAQIVDDVFSLAKVDKIPYSKVFEYLQFLVNDDSYFTWYPAFNGFNYIFRRLGRESAIGKAISAELSYLMEKLYQSVPMTNLNEYEHLYTLKQVLAINWACTLGKEECVNSVTQAFRDFKNNGTRPNKNLKSIVYCNALRYSEDPSDWDFLWQTYLDTELATERAVLISALGCSTDEETLKNYLLKSINATSGIRSQDAYSVFSAVYSNAIGVDVAFDFLIQYYQEIDDYYQSMNSLTNIMSGIAGRLTTWDQISKLETFIASVNLSDAFQTAATESLATATANLEWIEEYKLDLIQYYGIEEEVEVDEQESSRPEYRLSKIFKPEHYEVHLNTPREAFTASGTTFTGTAVIYFKVTTSTARILLHSSSDNIQIQSIQLNNEDIPSANYSVNSTTDILKIDYPAGLKYNTQYALRIEYNGTLASGLRGFYKSSYTTNGETRYLLTTQFEPTHARRAFPCFDEPSFKATFQILLTYPSEYRAWSNTLGSAVIVDSPNNFTTYQFAKTPVTPSYLIAFVISDFTCTAGENVGEATTEVCSRDDESANRAWAVEMGSKVLASLNEFTGFNYSNAMSKMDQFAIPDFNAGAMENWGLVTYREYYLLWDPAESTNSYKQSIATVIAHEFGHQWFGNLITCSWWSEIFLNEGFATYTEFFTTHDVLPDWQLDKQFVVRVHQPVLTSDSYLTAQPLQSVASTPTEISNKFGTISYSKGGSILRMVEHIMGSESWKAGVQHYLEMYAYTATKPEQLWTALSHRLDAQVSNLPADLETVMENWVKKSGYPLLSVAQVGSNIVVSQNRFLLSGEDTASKWYVPISYTTSLDQNKFESTTPVAWLTPTSDLLIPYPTGAEWIVLNNHETAFYRVNYTAELWTALATALRAANFSGIPELNRAQITDDVLEYTKYSLMTFTQGFTVLEFLEYDDSYFSWYAVNTELTTLIDNVGLHTRIGQAMQDHIVRLIDKLYQSAPASLINDDDQLYTLRQILAVNLACRLHHQQCGADIKRLFTNFKDNGVIPPKNIRSLVYCNGLRHNGTREEWDHILDQYAAADSSTDRSTFLSALGCITDQQILRDYLQLSISSDSVITSTDTSSVFSAVYSHPAGVAVAFDFFKENQQAIYDHFGSWTSPGNLLLSITNRFRTNEEVEELRAFVTSGEILSGLVSAGNSAITAAETKVAWVNERKDDFYSYYGLQDDEPTTPPGTTTPAPAPTTTNEPSTTLGATTINSSLLLMLVAAAVNKYLF
ncbi:hypothetical protein NQ315_003108 [Exocentrus adspersus]|uniref:Aminopeptidase N n=1 Tax=Exocentrus adspersus TaxID=1586481 RepID=A0AAV8W4I6_9CUCU|nr:hypothetical protein NQ315_003108 [Exocentrus adspersus]